MYKRTCGQGTQEAKSKIHRIHSVRRILGLRYKQSSEVQKKIEMKQKGADTALSRERPFYMHHRE